MERAETDAYPVPSQCPVPVSHPIPSQFIPIMLAPRQNQQLGDSGQSRFMGSLQENKHEEQGFFFFFFISISVLQRSAGIEQDGSRPPVSAPGAGNAVYHQNGSCGPGRAAIYERKMYLGTTKSSVFQAWPSLTLNFYFFFPSFSFLRTENRCAAP